jgi:predicted RNA-binding Zn-ribbon protein involved in translation (DUF1610 family)
MDESELPLTCPRCRQTTTKPIRWLQENTFFTCDQCGATVLIDKDEATRLLAQLQGHG